MVCPNKKPKGKFHIYVNDVDMGEIDHYIETDEDVRISNRLYSKWLLTPQFSVPIKYQPLYVMRSTGWLMKDIMESPFIQASARLLFIRGKYAVRPLTLWGIM